MSANESNIALNAQQIRNRSQTEPNQIILLRRIIGVAAFALLWRRLSPDLHVLIIN